VTSVYVQLAGCGVAFIGAFIRVIVQQPTKALGVMRDDGREYYVIYLRSPGFWRFGLILLIVGFVVQAAATCLLCGVARGNAT
jgi:hypothetical protein